MIEPSNGICDCLDGRDVRQLRPAHHDHREAEATRRRNFPVDGRATTVLGDDDFDAVRLQHRLLVCFREWTASSYISGVRHRQRRIHRVDTAHQIMMLRRVDESRQFATAEREENAARSRFECFRGSLKIGDFDPSVPADSAPGRSSQRQQPHTGGRCGAGGVVGYDRRIRVGGIDDSLDALIPKVERESFNASKATDTDRDFLGKRRRGATCKRESHGEPRSIRKAFCEPPGFGCPAENENPHVAC